MKKILIAIKNNFTLEIYSEVFKEKDFEVFSARDGKEALDLVKEEKPNIILADVDLSEIGGFELLETLRKDPTTQKIPVIIFTQIEKKLNRAKAIELEAKDFITATEDTPLEIIRRVKIALGEQKSYRISILKDLHDSRELITDLGCSDNFKCPKCGSDLLLYLIRDLSKGEKHFILSIVCSKCNK